MLVIVGLIVAFILVAIYARRGMRGCRWREYRAGGCDVRVRWQCVACGAEVFTSDGGAPTVCHDPRRSRT